MPNPNEMPHATPPAQPNPQPQAAPQGAAPGGDIMSSLQSLAASGMFGGASKSGKPETVFTGQYGPQSGSNFYIRGGQTLDPSMLATPVTENIQTTINKYYQWSDQEKQDLRNKLSLIDKSALTASDNDIAKVWGDYAQQAANYFAAGQNVTPWDIIARDISTRSGQPAASKAGTHTSTTTDTNLTSRIDSDAIFRSAAQSLLGRDPTSAESAKFQSILNAQEENNPTTATISTTTDDQGRVIDTKRTSQGGVTAAGAAELARREALQNPESGAYQAATTYYNAFRQALAS